MAVQVIDDYLSNSEWTYLSDTMMGAGGDFPWKYSPNKVRGGDEDHQFTHQFYSIGRKSDWFGLVAPLMKRFHVLGVYRIKSNLEPNSGKRRYSEFHCDYNDPATLKPASHMTTCIYYVNTCNGYTEFEDGTIVESVANRMAVFSSSILHRGVTQTDTKVRCVINCNWFNAL